MIEPNVTPSYEEMAREWLRSDAMDADYAPLRVLELAALLARVAEERDNAVLDKMAKLVERVQQTERDLDAARRARDRAEGEVERLVEHVQELERELDAAVGRLVSARQAMSQALDALESDADLDQRRIAFQRIQDEFDGVEGPAFWSARSSG